jgi:hypothetical protein
MAKDSELRREAAEERQQLSSAVDSLKEEIGNKAERGKQIGTAVGATIGAALALRTALKIRRLFRD